MDMNVHGCCASFSQAAALGPAQGNLVLLPDAGFVLAVRPLFIEPHNPIAQSLAIGFLRAAHNVGMVLELPRLVKIAIVCVG